MHRLLVLVCAACVVGAVVQPASTAREVTLLGTVGPGPSFFSLETLDEKLITRLKAGQYYFVIRDRSSLRNFHLYGPGIDRRTPVRAVHVYGWHLRLRKGIYTYVSDPQRGKMRQRFRVA